MCPDVSQSNFQDIFEFTNVHLWFKYTGGRLLTNAELEELVKTRMVHPDVNKSIIRNTREKSARQRSQGEPGVVLALLKVDGMDMMKLVPIPNATPQSLALFCDIWGKWGDNWVSMSIPSVFLTHKASLSRPTVSAQTTRSRVCHARATLKSCSKT